MVDQFLSEQAIMNTPLVSIIVPVYNTEKYICECLTTKLLTYRDYSR